jgi:hypothetical protein
MKLRSIVAAAALFGVTGAQAVEIFSDNFNAAIEGLSVVPTGWTVTDGTVDVVGTVFPLCEGTGLCVDLDGSSSNAGVLSRNFDLQGGVLYTLSFDLAGSQRGSIDDVEVRFGSALLNIDDIASAAPNTTYTLDFTPAADGSFAVSFANAGGDNLGAILDNVAINGAVQVIPEPETYALMLLGLGALAQTVRRRRRGAA